MKIFLKITAVFLTVLCISALTSCGNTSEDAVSGESAGTTEGIVSEETTTPETTTEVTTTPTATTEATTPPETTTEETTQTTPEETTTIETTTHEITAEEAAILAELTDEEKQVWLTMPDIVTMRMLTRYNEKEKEIYSEFLYNEIVYIDKMGQVRKFITYDDSGSPYDDVIIPWLNDQISENENAELIDVADIHTLIKFYNTFMCIDSDSQWISNHTIGLNVEFYRHYWFEIYGIRNNGENPFETLLISSGDAGDYEIRRNKTEEGEPKDKSGRETFDLYLELDPFMVKNGFYGYLTGESK
ncbi:MAG: hypothetical protein J1E40_08765 [Oscillospiraceae bacterium]|nr:hypothetical protein [Oscillospiraceae bacterium]